MDTTTAITKPVSPPPAALWEDFVDIFFAPRSVFERRADGRFWVPLLVLVVVLAGLFYASLGALGTAYDAEFQRGLDQAADAGQEVSVEQVDQIRGMSSIFGTLSLLVAVPVGVLLIGVLIWGVGKLFDATTTLALAIVISTYAQFPKVLQNLVNIVQGLLFDPRSIAAVSLSPARFLDPAETSQVVMILLGRLDLFVIWTTILVAIGLQVLGRVPRTSAYLAAFLVWLLAGVPLVLAAVMA